MLCGHSKEGWQHAEERKLRYNISHMTSDHHGANLGLIHNPGRSNNK
jgi:hypothetical protein